MLNQDLQLKTNIFDSPESLPTRDGFGKALIELGENDPRVVVLCADLAESTRALAFKEKYPDRYIELGVAEQNLATIAAGLANYGKIPFIASYAAFSPGRNNEQIRTTISLNYVPVKVMGMHAGVSVGPDGATHQALEDMALMRVQPNMLVISPCDAEEARKAVVAVAAHPNPVYVRFAREKTPMMTTSETPFEIGKLNVVWRSENPAVVLFATGPLLYQTLVAARELGEQGINVTVANVHTIKPIDREAIVSLAREAGAVVTVEEHQIAGGLGSAIAEVLAQEYPVPQEFIGIHDRFGQSGEPNELLKEYNLDTPAIVAAVKKVIERKGKWSL